VATGDVVGILVVLALVELPRFFELSKHLAGVLFRLLRGVGVVQVGFVAASNLESIESSAMSTAWVK
jgi:hypothetical protein